MFEQFVRLFSILSFLSPHSAVRPADVAEALGLSEVVVEQDFRLLSELPIDLQSDVGGAFRVSPPGFQRIVSLARPAGVRS